jgi:hypothetical protein
MQKSTIISIVLMAAGALFLILRLATSEQGMGKAYVRAVPQAVDAQHPEGRWQTVASADPAEYWRAEKANPEQTEVRVSWANSIGIWVAAFFTLAIFSFLFGDNPAYKVAEAMVVGVSAAYWMVVGFWEVIVPNLLGKLMPGMIKAWSMPGLDAEPDLMYIVPLILGILLLWRLAPKGAWIARWPMAFIIGVFCGLRLISFIHADFLSQIRNSIVPLVVMTESGFSFWDSVRNLTLVVGILSCLVYFFFSIEHKGLVGKTARLGTWFLMITFGAAFGYTVMGRIALLAIRLEFLFDDWLWLIDPNGRRALSEAVSLLQGSGVLG